MASENDLRHAPIVAPAVEVPDNDPTSLGRIASLIGMLELPLLIADRGGHILASSLRARQHLQSQGVTLTRGSNLFLDVLRIDPTQVSGQIENGEPGLDMRVECGKSKALVQWLPDPDWLVVRIEEEPAASLAEDQSGTGHTVQALLQERELTYRNLLAAYLRLQEVNRQKTVFLASAAHELKTPLAVIKGYYDLLLSGSLGKLTDKQRDILQESKESSERLVRLVSMFLNYSALESGKLVLHLRENDLRDCLGELATRWREAFVRKQVRLESLLSADLPIFKFDYQKVQQTVANLLDNALKHTPPGGEVTLRAERHFWERRSVTEAQAVERRRRRVQLPNSVKISVSDTGQGIASEHHQEIFEDFVRVDRSSSGMGLGLAIAKRLVQAHRGKIWLESKPRQGCTFTFLLPVDQS